MPGAKNAQRVKGNLKPSSSSQAVQLLAQSGHSATGFIGFSNQPAYVPASEIFDDAESALDADFRLVLRKFSKKDTVTKIKALQEFSTLCSSKSDDCIKSVVPFWPRIYNKVAIDVDHKVRELSQKALLALAERAGKNLSPQLRSIMGTWMVSMCDSYPSVASAASSTFAAVFPPAKQTAAIRFCKAECAECFLSNVIKQTPQTLSDPLTTSEEDMKGKYNRVVASSLQAMRKMVTILLADSSSDAEFLATQLKTLLDSSAFWKHAKSGVSIINAGILSILSCICQQCPSVSGPFVNKISPLVFSFIDSNDPVTVSQSWEALLCLMNAHDDCWEHVNWQKAVWPKLKAVLEGGCGGQADVIAPCMLPLISKLPQKKYTQLFDAFRLGLNQENVVNSPSSMSALIKAFVECIHYCVKNSSQTAEADVQGLIHDQVLVVVEASLTDQKVALSKSPLYHSLSPLVGFLGNQHAEIEREFWKELSRFTRHHLLSYLNAPSVEKESSCPGDSKNVQPSLAKPVSRNSFVYRLSCLVSGLVFQDDESPKKDIKVKFQTQEDVQSKETSQIKRDKKPMSLSLEHFISDILVTSFYLATEFEALEFIHLFKNISMLHVPFETAKRLNNREDSLRVELLEELRTRHKEENTTEIDKKVQELYRNNHSNSSDEFTQCLYLCLLKFILNEENRLTGPALEFTNDLILSWFGFLQYVGEDDAVQFLTTAANALSSSSSSAVMCQFIEHLLQHVHSIPACAKALSMSDIHTKISDIAVCAVGIVQGEGVNNEAVQKLTVWRMLVSFVSHLGQGPVISNSSLDAVIDNCVTSLGHCQEKNAGLSPESFSGLLSVVQILFENSLVKGHSKFSELMSNLLNVVLDPKNPKDKVETVLAAAFTLIVSDLPTQDIYLHEICTSIRNWVCARLKTHEDLDRVSKTVELLVSVVSSHHSKDDDEKDATADGSGLGGEEGKMHDASGNILHNMLCVESFHVDELAEIINELYVEGKLFYPHQRDDAKSTVMSLKCFALLSLYNCRTIKTLHGLNASQTDDQTSPIHSLTDREMFCLVQNAAFLFVFDCGHKDSHLVKTQMADTVEELRKEVNNCVLRMTGRQIQALVDTAIKSSESCSLPVAFGLEKCLVDLLQFGAELHSKRSVSSGVQLLQTRFIHRCVSVELEADSITSSLLDKAAWTGRDVANAYTSVCSSMMESDSFSLPRISECIFSFVRLLANCGSITYEDQVSLFNQTLDVRKALKDKDVHLLTGSDSDAGENLEVLQYNACVARAMTAIRLYRLDQYWEFTLCTLVEWIQFLSELDVNDSLSYEVQSLMASTYHLAHFVSHTFATAPVIDESIESESDKSLPPEVAVHQKTKTEWEEFFSEGVFSPTLYRFVYIATKSFKSSNSRSWTSVLNSLSSAITLCPSNILLNHDFPARLTTTDSSGIPDGLKTLLNHLCPLLNSTLWKLQIAVFHLLDSVMDEVAQHEAKSVEKYKDDSQEEEEARSPPEALCVMIEANAACLDTFLMLEDMEQDVDLDIGTQEHSLALGYLLAWGVQLRLFKSASNELRAQYAQFFKSHHYVSHLCDHLFHLMPSYPSSSMMGFQLALDGKDEMSGSFLGSLAISIYCQCLEVLPALVRTWWNDQNRKASNFVDKFTTQYITNTLCTQQLTSSDMTSASIEDITIRPRPAAREVSAVYEMAEVTVNMTIKLPENYPLGKVDVSCDKRVGVSQAQWDKWLLQLNIFLQHQNGSIVEGLKLWKGNIDKKFEGIDDCMVCFSVIHGTTFQLPRLTCRTCRKKFHSSCLYKWFNTSQKSSCPLCRNLF